LKNSVENTAGLPGFHHVAVERVKDFGVGLHGSRQCTAAFDGSPRAGQDLLKGLVFLLGREDFETLHQRETGIDHHGELPREDRELLWFYTPAKGGQVKFLTLLGHFGGRDLLAAQQALQFVLVAGRHFSRDCPTRTVRTFICKDRHISSSAVESKLETCSDPSVLIPQAPAP